MVTITGSALSINPVKASTDTTMPINMGTEGWVDFVPFMPFLDYARVCQWRDNMSKRPAVNSLGYPIAVLSGSSNVSFIVVGSADHPTWLAQPCVVKWNSSQNLTFGVNGGTFTGKTWDSGTGNGSATVTFTTFPLGPSWALPGGGSGTIDISAVSIIPQKTYSNGYTAQQLLDAGHFFSPDYLLMWTSLGKRLWAIRTMGNCNPNNDLALYDTADIPTTAKSNWALTSPYPVISDFSNQVNPENIWINTKPNCTSGFRQGIFNQLKAEIAADTVVIVEKSNEEWNNGFSQIYLVIGQSLVYFGDLGATDIYKSASAATVTAPSTVALPTGGWAAAVAKGCSVASAVSLGGRMYGIKSIASDTLTLSDTILEATGSYTTYIGPPTYLNDMKAKQNEEVLQDLETVYGVGSPKFKTVLADHIGSTYDIQQILTAPKWQALDPTNWVNPATRHDYYAVAPYLGVHIMTEAMVQQYQTDPAGALAAFSAVMLANARGLGATLINMANTLATYAPTMKLILYEGGYGAIDDKLTTVNGLTGANKAWSTYTAAQALTMQTAWRNDVQCKPTAYQFARSLASSSVKGVQFVLENIYATSGIWGLDNNMSGTKDVFASALIDAFQAQGVADYRT